MINHNITLKIEEGNWLLTIRPEGGYRLWRLNPDHSVYSNKIIHQPELTELFRLLNEEVDIEGDM